MQQLKTVAVTGFNTYLLNALNITSLDSLLDLQIRAQRENSPFAKELQTIYAEARAIQQTQGTSPEKLNNLISTLKTQVSKTLSQIE